MRGFIDVLVLIPWAPPRDVGVLGFPLHAFAFAHTLATHAAKAVGPQIEHTTEFPFGFSFRTAAHTTTSVTWCTG